MSSLLCFFLQNSVEIALQQNEITNTFIDDWKCLAEEEGTFGDKTDTHLKEYQSFTDLHNLTEKMVTCVSWHPEIYGEMEKTAVPFGMTLQWSVAFMCKIENQLHFSKTAPICWVPGTC